MRKLHWTTTVAVLAAPACLPAIAPWLASWHWSLDLLACFPVQAICWLALAAVTLAIARKWWLAGAAATFGAIGFLAIVASQSGPNNSPDNVENAPRIRLLTLNLLRENEQGHAAAWEVIQHAQPDVIFCSEYTPHWQRFLETRLDAWPHRCARPDHGHFGVAMFSRWPLTGEIRPMPQHWEPAIRATVTTPHGAIGVLGVHTPPPGFGERRARRRDDALLAVAAALDGLPDRRVVLGDCNATPWNQAFGRMRRDAGLGGGTATGLHPTWPAQLPLPFRIPIDHVLVSAGLVVDEVEVGAAFGSDHLPLSASVRIVR